MANGSIQQEGIKFVNIYALNRKHLKYIRQVLTDIKGEIDNKTIIVRDFNTSLTSMGRSPPGRKSKKTTGFK